MYTPISYIPNNIYLIIIEYSAADYVSEDEHQHGYNRLTKKQVNKVSNEKRSLSVKQISTAPVHKMNNVPLTGVFDRNGNPIKNAFVKIPENQKKALDAAQMNNFLNPTPNPSIPQTRVQTPMTPQSPNLQQLNNLPPGSQKRRLFLDSITGALGSVTGGVGDAIGGVGGALGGMNAGTAVGIGAAGAGMAARTARKEQFYFDKTKIELRMNFEDFRREYMDYEYTELRNCNRLSARINGQLSALEKNLVYRVNNRILEMIDAA